MESVDAAKIRGTKIPKLITARHLTDAAVRMFEPKMFYLGWIPSGAALKSKIRKSRQRDT
jgi:hypothetical protein